MSDNAYLKCDSSKRLNQSTTSPGDFILQLQRPLLGSYSLKQIAIPLSFFNVNSSNNLIYFYENGAAKIATLTTGYYADADLLVQLKTALDAASGGYATYTITRSALPLRITISSTQNFQLTFGSNIANSAAELMGFTAIDTQLLTFQTATNIQNLSTVQSFMISVNNENGFITADGMSSSFVIPVLGVSQTITVYEPSSNFPQKITFHSPTSVLKVKVADDRGNVINLFADWYFILQKDHC